MCPVTLPSSWMATAAGRPSGICRALPGHSRGLDAVRAVVEACAARGVQYLTLFAFSSENWRRPADEVSFLMRLFMTALRTRGGQDARQRHPRAGGGRPERASARASSS
ncbi:undecaprenyl diphosphate synthase family protein [Cupriavidus basilensis]